MNDPIFLTLDHALRIHSYQVETFGGSDAMLDLGKLEAAIAMPRQGFGGQYFHKDLPEMAAAYLFHIVQNHAFEDGNKRTGIQAAIIFLDFNGCELDIPVEGAERLTVGIAKGELGKADATTFFRTLIDQQCAGG